MPVLARRLLLPLGLALLPVPGLGQSNATTVDTAALQRILVAEDARGTGRDGLAPLLDALTSSDAPIRSVAVRGLGRLQRPDLGRRLLPTLVDTVPAVRAEAANALAQSMRRAPRDAATRDPFVSDSSTLTTREAAAALTNALRSEADPRVIGELAQALGRLPLPDSAAARAAEQAIRNQLVRQPTPGVLHGLYTLARARRATGTLDALTVGRLRIAARTAADSMSRRLALLALAATSGLDSATAAAAARDADSEVRRAMLRGVATLSAGQRAALVRQGLADRDPIVRTQAVVASRLGDRPTDCTPILPATRDASMYVALAAIDSLGGGCADGPAAVHALRAVVARTVGGPVDHRWQLRAHALLSLARLDRETAMPLLSDAAAAHRGEVRQYAARAAMAVGDRSLLLHLADDPDRNVQEVAIAGLASTAGHDADSVYLRALGSSGFQVVLAASDALKGTTHQGAGAALLQAFDRLSALRSENARDPRMSLLDRIGELRPGTVGERLRPYLTDFDTTVAGSVATILSGWSGTRVEARPVPLPIRAEPLAATFLRYDVRVRVRLAGSSGGGTFIVRLFADEAPATVARVLRLVREGFYDGRVLQRVEPNFVVQGGGPDANEYVGDSAFMRDELTSRVHARGTVGISARGRDTGDGQWFINLVDNPLLDHEYTVFGRIVTGQDVAERILEGDRIARMEVITDR